MQIVPLADAPHALPVIAGWHWGEWGRHEPGSTVETFAARLAGRSTRDGLPVLYVALDGAAPAGTVSLLAQEMTTHPELGPWLAGLYVPPERRGSGLGRTLTLHAMAEARRLGADRLYLYTRSAVGLYAALGWRPLAEEPYQGRPVTIMAADPRQAGRYA